MADDKIQLEAGLSIEELIKQLTAMKELAVQATKELNDAYEKLRVGNNDAAQQIGTLLSRVTEQRKQIEGLTVQLGEMAKNNTAAFDDSAAKKYQEQIATLRADMEKMRKDGNEALKPLNADALKGAPLIASLKDKIRGLREEQLLIKNEIKDYNTALVKNEAEIKRVDTALGSLSKTSKTYRTDQAALIKEIDSLRDKQVALRTGLLDSKDAMAQNQTELKNTTKELVAASTASGGFGQKMLGLLPILRTVAQVIPGLGIGTLILALLTPIIELGKALFGLSDAQKKAEETAGKLNEVMLKGLNATSDTRVEMEALLIVARDTNRSEEERLAAIRKINEAMPEYNNQITLENINSQETAKAIETYIEASGKKAKAQAYISVIQKAYNELIALETQLQLAGGEAALSSGGIFGTISGQVAKSIQKNIDLQKLQIKTLEDKFKLDLKTGDAEIDLNKQLEANKKDAADAEKKRLKDIEDAKKKADDDERKRKSEQAKAAREAAAALREQEAAIRRVADLEKQLATLRAQLAGEGRQTDIAAENARFKNAIDALTLLRGLEKTTAAEKKLIDQLVETNTQVHYKKLGDIDKKYYDDALKAFTDAQNAIDNTLLKDQDKEAAAIDAKYKKLFDQIEIARKKVLDTAKDNPLVKSSINFEFDSKLADLTEQQKKDQADIVKKYDLKSIDEAETLAKAQADIIQVSGLNQAALVRVREVAKLNIEIEFAKKRLDILKATGDPKDELRIAQLTKAIEDAQNKLNKIGKNDGKSFLEFLGLTDKDIDALNIALNAAGALSTVMQSVTDVFTNGIDRQIEAKQKLIDAIQESIDKQQEAVDKEKELAEQGFANSLGIEEQRLAALQGQKDKELEQEKKLKEQKAKLQKAQIVADTFAQVSNIITASSEIFKAFSAIPVVGVPLAIAAVALMIGSFIASKAQALKAANQMRAGGDLDISKTLDGKPSHEAGGVDVVDNKTGETIAELEGDEKLFVVNKGKAAKYKSIIEAINRDELKDWSIEKFIHEKSGTSTTRTVQQTSAVNKSDTVTISIDRELAEKYKAVIDAITTGTLATWTAENFYSQKITGLNNQITENNRRISINEQTIAKFKSDISNQSEAIEDRRRITRETAIDRMERQNHRLIGENTQINRRITEVLEARARKDRKSYTLDEIFESVIDRSRTVSDKSVDKKSRTLAQSETESKVIDTHSAEYKSQETRQNIPQKPVENIPSPGQPGQPGQVDPNRPAPIRVRAAIEKTVQDSTTNVQKTQINVHSAQLNAHSKQLISIDRKFYETHKSILDAIDTREINTWTIDKIMTVTLSNVQRSIEQADRKRTLTDHTHTDHVDTGHSHKGRSSVDHSIDRVHADHIDTAHTHKGRSSIDHKVDHSHIDNIDTGHTHKGRSSMDHKVDHTHADHLDTEHTHKGRSTVNHESIDRSLVDHSSTDKSSVDHSHAHIDHLDTGHTHKGRSSADHQHSETMRTNSDYHLSREIYNRYRSVLDAIDSGTLHKWTAAEIYDFKSTINRSEAPPPPVKLISITEQLTLASDTANITTERLRAMILPTGISFHQAKAVPMDAKTMIAMQQKKELDYSETLDRIARSNESILAMERDKETTTETPTHKIIKKGNHVRMVRKMPS